MTRKVEEVARAIRAASSAAGRGDSHLRSQPLTEDVCIDLARAAIKAMREVDNEALEAMWHAMFVGEFTAHELPMLGAGWEAAIDAALSEEGR